jgi:hypothetical protein
MFAAMISVPTRPKAPAAKAINKNRTAAPNMEFSR